MVNDYLGAVESFKKTIPLKIGNPLLILWDAYANYLYFEFSSNLTGENIVSIIRKLETAELPLIDGVSHHAKATFSS
ncbi:MAG: hypothetical protein KAJ93_02950, partial [Methanosarcinales archaeon]|nr:hypothetical protein [Methanosarcinales archaeon]